MKTRYWIGLVVAGGIIAGLAGIKCMFLWIRI